MDASTKVETRCTAYGVRRYCLERTEMAWYYCCAGLGAASLERCWLQRPNRTPAAGIRKFCLFGKGKVYGMVREYEMYEMYESYEGKVRRCIEMFSLHCATSMVWRRITN